MGAKRLLIHQTQPLVAAVYCCEIRQKIISQPVSIPIAGSQDVLNGSGKFIYSDVIFHKSDLWAKQTNAN